MAETPAAARRGDAHDADAAPADDASGGPAIGARGGAPDGGRGPPTPEREHEGLPEVRRPGDRRAPLQRASAPLLLRRALRGLRRGRRRVIVPFILAVVLTEA